MIFATHVTGKESGFKISEKLIVLQANKKQNKTKQDNPAENLAKNKKQAVYNLNI